MPHRSAPHASRAGARSVAALVPNPTVSLEYTGTTLEDGAVRDDGAARDTVIDLDPPAGVMPAVVDRARHGDAAAFGEIYDSYVDVIYRYVYFRVGSVVLAEDLTSETFLRALRRMSSFSWQGRDIGAWLVTIARNLVLDHVKSCRHRLEVVTGEVVESPRLVEGPEAQVLAGLRDATLLAAVRGLGREQQECIVLRFLAGLSVTETAVAMGRTEGAVKALQHRAVRNLGQMLPALADF